VRGLEVESNSSRQLLLIQGISFEGHGGEIMAVMATSKKKKKKAGIAQLA
jgi:hypothetical protein